MSVISDFECHEQILQVLALVAANALTVPLLLDIWRVGKKRDRRPVLEYALEEEDLVVVRFKDTIW